MKSVVLASGTAPSGTAPSWRPVSSRTRALPRPFTASQRAPAAARNVTANLFRFGKNDTKSQDPNSYQSVGGLRRDDYDAGEVDDYFNYMGFLATEGSYDRMEALLKSGLHPIDIILLLACSENDTPKIEEILNAGANPRVKGLDGKSPMEIATKPEVLKLLQNAMAKSPVA